MAPCRTLLAAALAISAMFSGLLQAQTCSPRITPGYDFGRLSTVTTSLSNSIFAAAVFDDHSGTGPALFVGGDLSVLGDLGGSWMAKLVGDHWIAVPGFNGMPRCMTVLDDGTGPALYVGGSFSVFPGGAGCLAKWDGTTWTGLGLAVVSAGDGGIYALARHDDGNGTALYAGGRGFAPPGQTNNSLVMRYDGSAWSSLDSGGWAGNSIYDSMAVRAMISFDNGAGTRLYVGGSFNTVPGGVSQASPCVAVWDGVSWLAAGGGLPTGGEVKSFAVHQGALFAAGDGIQQAVWRWNGSGWATEVGTGAPFTTIGGTGLLSYDDGTGSALYAIVGNDSHSGSLVLRRNGTAWTPMGSQFVNVMGSSRTFMTTLLKVPAGDGMRVACVGRCSASGPVSIPNVAAWNNGAWGPVEPVGLGVNPAGTHVYYDPEVDDGSVYIGSARYTASGPGPLNIPFSAVYGMVRLHSGGNSALVVLGAGGNELKINDGSGWQSLPNVPSSTIFIGVVQDTGVDSLVAVSRTSHTTQVWRLVGTAWTPVGPAITIAGLAGSSTARCILSYDGGAGPRLYLGGYLGTIGSVTNCYLAYLEGGQWQPVAGVPGPVTDLRVFDVGGGTELIVASTWTSVAGIPATGGVLRWNGSRLDDLSASLGTNPDAKALLPFDDGTGTRLWVASTTSQIGSLAFWNGSAWQSYPGLNANGFIYSIAPARRAGGTHALFLSGSFTAIGNVVSSGIGELATCPRTCSADFNGDGDWATDGDIEAFFACLAGNCCDTCGAADFNNDGVAGTDSDIESFFRVLAGGGC